MARRRINKLLWVKYYKKYKEYKKLYTDLLNKVQNKYCAVMDNPELDFNQVKLIVNGIIGQSHASMYPDSIGSMISKNDVEELIHIDDTDKYKYVDDRMDCDDFSVILLGRIKEKYGSCNFGEIWIKTGPGNGHTLNIYVDVDNNQVYLIEPQTDKWSEYDGQNVLYIRF